MRAAVLRAAGQPVTIEEVRVRDPGPGEVRVAIRAAGLCHSDLSVIDGAIPYPTPVVLGHEGAGVVDAIGPGVTAVKEGDAVVLSTLAHCGRCPACEVGRPTECRNAPSPKDARPFTLDGEPAYQFANASAFVNYTVVREQSAIPIDARVPFDRPPRRPVEAVAPRARSHLALRSGGGRSSRRAIRSPMCTWISCPAYVLSASIALSI